VFDLLDRPLIFIPVEWPGLIANDAGDAVPTTHSLEVQIELLDRAEFTEWMKEGSTEADEELSQADKIARERSTFRRVAKGWRKIKANGRVPEFSDENIERLLMFPGFNNAFGTAYIAAWSGKVATREGNSAGSPVNGPGGEPTDATKTDTTPSN